MIRSIFLLSVLLFGSSADLMAGECRVPTRGGSLPEKPGDGEFVVRLERDLPALFTLNAAGGRTFSLSGHLCDEQGSGLANVRIRLVRYEKKDPRLEPKKLRADDFGEESDRVVIHEPYVLLTSPDGLFTAAGLASGSWAILVEWSELSLSTDEVIIDAHRTLGYFVDSVVGSASGRDSDPLRN